MSSDSNYRKIKEQIESMTDYSKFQKLCVRFIRIFLQHIFENIIPFSGMNVDGVSKKGHPDAYSHFNEGIAALEVSHINQNDVVTNAKKSVNGLKQTIDKEKWRLTYLCFVFSAFCDDRPPMGKYEEIKDYANHIFEIDKEKIRIIFGYELITALNNIKYCVILRDYFENISFSKYPFEELIPELKKKNHPFPTITEFNQGGVFFQGDVLSYIKRRLESDNQFLITGGAGSGKTVTSFIMGMDYLKKDVDVLYLDFKEHKSDIINSEIYEFLEKNCDSGSNLLIILDNIHIHPQIIHLLPQIKKLQIDHNFKVLYLSRNIRYTLPPSDNKNFFEIYSEEDGKYINLDDIPNKFDFVLKRFQQKKLFSLGEQKIDFEKLNKDFGEDMFLFTFTIGLQKNNFNINKLSPDSKEVGLEIQNRFLTSVQNNSKELNRFIDLCGFCSLDIWAPKSLFKPLETPYENPFEDYRKQGIVIESNKEIYNLTHSSLGYLIFRYHCKSNSINHIERLTSIIKKVPELGPQIVENIPNQNKYPIEILFASLFGDGKYILEMLNHKILLTTEQVFIINNYYPKFRKIYFNILNSNFNLFSKVLIYSDLHSIRNYISYLKGGQKAFEEILKIICEGKEEIINKCKQTAPHWLKDFFDSLKKYSQDKTVSITTKTQIEKLIQEVIDRITNPEDKASIFEMLINSNYSLEYVRSFLDYIRPKKIDFHNDVIKEIVNMENREKLIKRGLINPLNHFTNFLDYVHRSGAFNPENIIDDLKKSENFSLLRRRLLAVPFDISLNFIGFWNRSEWTEGQMFYKDLIKDMFSKENKDKLINLISNSNLIHIVKCFEFMNVNKISFEFLKPEVLDNNLMSPLFNRFHNLSFSQIERMINRLNNCGGVSEDLSKKLVDTLINTEILKEDFEKSNIFDKIKILKFLDTKRDVSKELSKKLLTNLKNERYFEKWILNTLSTYSNKRKPLFGKNYTTDLSILSIIIDYLNNNESDYFIEILVKLKEKENNIINLLLSEHIDKIGDFLRKLDANDTSKGWSDELRKKLISDGYMDSFIRNSLSRDINYLTFVLEYHDKKFGWFLNPIFHKLETQYFDRLVDRCSKSMPDQLVYFLNYLDKPMEPKLEITSEMILKSLFTDDNKKKFFMGRYEKGDKGSRSQFTEYLIKKYPQYVKELA